MFIPRYIYNIKHNLGKFKLIYNYFGCESACDYSVNILINMIFTLKCQICSKEFTSKNKNKKYCSNECHKKGIGAAYIKSIEEKYGSYENFEKHRAEVRKPLSIEAKQAKCEKIKASVIEHYGSYENF